ncbi:MAG TPA: UvrD-helicase domain-containing protein [Alphaproteobacteria bacterium]|nr:UvrD-helicase domain-containing protein [Alphaproteobacteria bacterium]
MADPFEFTDDPVGAPAPPRKLSEAAMPRAAMPYLETLNPPQRAAVETLEGPLLVLAGAGTGKTRVLTTRLVHILTSRLAWPSQILAVTFTNRAAREMRDRVERLIGSGAAEGLALGTFHSLGARMLRRHAELVGLKSNFTILDDDDQIRLLKQVLAAENIDDKRWPARALLGVIQRWKDRGLTPDKVDAAEAGDFAGGKLAKLYAEYQARLRTLNAADFGDLLLHILTIFTSHHDVLAEYQERFKYLLVDEYQDTNVAQYLWLRLLAQKRRNICCVGDDDQSIYGWRGAEVGNILKFEKDFEGAKVVRLEQNYRSTGHILGAASGLIAKNEGRLGKTLWTEVGEGDKVALTGLWDGEAEARLVAEEIETLQRRKHALNDVAILVRASFQTREFEERFITVGLPYRVIGGPRFYERMEIRDAIAYMRVIHQPDDGLAFERIVNTPRRGIGNASVQAIHRHAREKNISLTATALDLVETDEIRPAARRSLKALLDDFARWRTLAEGADHAELAEVVLDEAGYTAMWQNDKTPEAPGRLENLKELITAMEEFENLAGFLEHVSLVMEAVEGSQGDMVNLMTLHSAKGLEFESVFLPGWEEGLFPHQRAMDESGAAGLEEERRLAYVGLTRARKRAYISFAANRRVHGQWQSAIPSRFVDELPPEHVEVSTESGLYGGGRDRGASRGGGFAGYGRERGGGDRWATPTARGDSGRAQTNWGRSAGGSLSGGGAIPQPRARRGVLIEGSAEPVSAKKAPRFASGARVFHDKFGYGTVTAVEGDKLTIDFDHTGEKKVMESFVEEGK